MEAELHRAKAWEPTQFGVPDELLGPSDGHDGNTVLYPAVDHGYGDSVSDPFRKRKLW